MRISRVFVVLLFLGGLALLGGMMWQVGVAGLLESFRVMGPWIAPYMLLKVIPILCHTAAWSACFPGSTRPPPLWRLALVRQAGGAVNRVMPTVEIAGAVTKVLLLEPEVPRDRAMASVVIDKASVTLAKMIYLALGMLYLAQYLPLPPELSISLSLTIGLITLGLVGFITCQRYGFLSRLIRWLQGLGVGLERCERLSRHVFLLDTQLVAYYTQYPWRFVRSLALHFASYVFYIGKVYILLRLLLGTHAPGFAEVVMIAVVVMALDQMFFFVPGRLGTLEGVRFMVLSSLGIAQVYGLAFGLIARLEYLVWSGLGMVAYAFYTRFLPRERPHGRRPRHSNATTEGSKV